MELNQLRYFILTAQLQNMSEASRALNIAQPTLSKNISNLEQELGCTLFDRSGKRLILNERGKQFLEKVQPSVQELDDAATAVQDEPSGNLKLGLFLYSGRLIKCVSEFSRQNPDVRFHFSYLRAAPDSIDTNEFDMLLYPRQVSFSKYRGEVIYSDGFYFAVNRKNPLAGKGKVSAADIEGQRLILLKHSKSMPDIPYELYNSLVSRKGKHDITNNHEIQREMIAENLAAGFVSFDCAGLYENHPDIVLLEVEHENLSREIMAGFKREKHLGESGRRFADFLRDYFGLPPREN